MNISTKLLKAAAGQAGGAGLDVDEVFSTFLYDGNGSTQTITNNIDLTGEGGLVWSKARDASQANTLFDTERGATKSVFSNFSLQEYTLGDALTGFTSSGYTLGGDASGPNINGNGTTYVSWTFRKAKKFFDVVTYTGDGSTTKTVSHNLDSTPAMILFKRTDSTGNWVVYHANTPASGYTQPYLRLNATFAATSLGDYGNNLAPTSTVIRTPVHTNSGNTADSVNVNGASYVAYLFAHNNSDGEFGPDSDQDVIKCGSYTGNGSATGPVVNLGFEPQWVMIKGTGYSDATGGDYRHWYIYYMTRQNHLQDSSS